MTDFGPSHQTCRDRMTWLLTYAQADVRLIFSPDDRGNYGGKMRADERFIS